MPRPDPGPEPRPTLYVVATSHLDTQWRWTVRETIRRHLPRTLAECFAAFERFPHFVLSFEGAFRYQLVREYYPAEFARLKEWVARGRWHPAGAMLEAADANIPAPESLIRQVLYGNRFFARELGRPSGDLFLPDGFGFPAHLPAIAAHCGLAGFSSQKFIKWMAPAAIPFDFGVWVGPDGSAVLAALNPDGYGDGIHEDLSRSRRWSERIARLAEDCGVGVGYKYFGPRGDRGGAPDAESLARLEQAATATEGLAVAPVASDRPFLDLPAAAVSRLPRHQGELLLPAHGTGCLTSQAAMKRYNRKNEQLAAAAERAATAAAWLGAAPYPAAKLRAAWLRFLWHQMHDDLTGTSLPAAYHISWNDEAVAANLFASSLTAAVGGVARALDTRAQGIAVVVFNPLAHPREDPVAVDLDWPGSPPGAVRVVGPDGAEVPAQLLRDPLADPSASRVRVLFLAALPPVGFAVYDLRPAAAAPAPAAALAVAPDRLENDRYRVLFDADGDPASILHKPTGRELLAAPTRLLLLPDRSRRWPAWEVRYEDVTAAPLDRLRGPAQVTVEEEGPARVALGVQRTTGGTRVVQHWRLAAGAAGDRLEAAVEIAWAERARLLKAAFPLAVGGAEATYDLGLGVTRRGINRTAKYEVPAQQFADLSSDTEGRGVAVLSDSRCGWDRPDERTLRLTLVRSPVARHLFRHQSSQDHGRHALLYALFAHGGDFAAGGVPLAAARLNQPPRAFAVPAHPGGLGRRFSFLALGDAAVDLTALKEAEDGAELVLRLRETAGRRAGAVALTLPGAALGVRELDGAEGATGGAPPAAAGGQLQLDLPAFGLRTLGVRLAPPSCTLPALATAALALPLDRPAASFHGERRGPDFDGRGASLPGELLPAAIEDDGIRFELGPREPGAALALACEGQVIDLPGAGEWEAVYLLATAVGGPERGHFALLPAGQGPPLGAIPQRIPDWSEPIGQWDRWRRGPLPWRRRRLPAHFEPAPIAWVATHRHDHRVRDEPYVFAYLFRIRLDLVPGARRLRLPAAPRIRLFAAALGRHLNDRAVPGQPLFD